MRTFRLVQLQFLLLLALIVFGMPLAPLHAQQTNSTAETARTTDPALREKAFHLLESLANQISSLQSAENRARLGSNIVGSLWAHDEKRARTLLVAVEEDIKAGLGNWESEDPRDIHTHMVFLRLREDTAERIGKHDAELALRFLKDTRVSFDKRRPYVNDGREHELELRLAQEIAAHNPDIALRLGRQSLARGLSNDLLTLLKQLSRKDRAKAQLLHKEIVDNLRSDNLAQDSVAWYFALKLVHSFAPPFADESVFRELINMFITTALANGCGNKTVPHDRVYFCREMGTLMPQMEKANPSRAEQLKQWWTEEQTSVSTYEGLDELNDLIQNGNVDDILSLASKYPAMEGEIHQHAMVKAVSNGDIERARRIATGYTGDPERKRRMLMQIDRHQMWVSMNEEKLAELQRTLATLPRLRDRIRFLLQHANRVGMTDRKSALILLNQASGIVDMIKPGKEQTEMQLALAMMYCLEKSDRGFTIMESVLPKLNDLVTSASKLDGYDNRYIRDGEWNMTGEGGVGDLLTKLARIAAYFAWCDFDRALSLAAQFDRTEIRLMAQLRLAQGILAGPPKRPTMANDLLP